MLKKAGGAGASKGGAFAAVEGPDEVYLGQGRGTGELAEKRGVGGEGGVHTAAGKALRERAAGGRLAIKEGKEAGIIENLFVSSVHHGIRLEPAVALREHGQSADEAAGACLRCKRWH
jgi:hypothetical protein